jgi:hypothetical protein
MEEASGSTQGLVTQSIGKQLVHSFSDIISQNVFGTFPLVIALQSAGQFVFLLFFFFFLIANI